MTCHPYAVSLAGVAKVLLPPPQLVLISLASYPDTTGPPKFIGILGDGIRLCSPLYGPLGGIWEALIWQFQGPGGWDASDYRPAPHNESSPALFFTVEIY